MLGLRWTSGLQQTGKLRTRQNDAECDAGPYSTENGSGNFRKISLNAKCSKAELSNCFFYALHYSFITSYLNTIIQKLSTHLNNAECGVELYSVKNRPGNFFLIVSAETVKLICIKNYNKEFKQLYFLRRITLNKYA